VLKKSNGDMRQVSNEEVFQAQNITFEMTGFKPCAAASTAVAGLRKFALQNGGIIKHKRVLLHLTGGGFEVMQQEKSMVYYQNSFSIESGDSKKAIEIIGKYISKSFPDMNLN
jgi:threonine synthase